MTKYPDAVIFRIKFPVLKVEISKKPTWSVFIEVALPSIEICPSEIGSFESDVSTFPETKFDSCPLMIWHIHREKNETKTNRIINGMVGIPIKYIKNSLIFVVHIPYFTNF